MSRLRVLSLGAGVQSSALALMASGGVFSERPDAAIFADTGWEPRTVYEWLDWLEPRLSFPVHRVSAGNIRNMATGREGRRYVSIPYFLGNGGMGRRQCTSEYKLAPIMRETRRLLGAGPRERIPPESVEVWIGISTDEAIRMKPARQQWMRNRWPLIEAGMSRSDCHGWMARNAYPQAPKSACIGCPFRSDAAWAEMKANAPDDFADAVAADKAIRNAGSDNGRAMREAQYVHPSRKPLDQVEFTDERQANLFGNECDGICGT